MPGAARLLRKGRRAFPILRAESQQPPPARQEKGRLRAQCRHRRWLPRCGASLVDATTHHPAHAEGMTPLRAICAARFSQSHGSAESGRENAAPAPASAQNAAPPAKRHGRAGMTFRLE